MLRMQDGDFTPTDDELAEWSSVYADINVNHELAKMSAWLNANPAKRKTMRGAKRFINAWLSKANEKGGSPQITQQDLSQIPTTFSPVERDDIIFKIQEVARFYRKEVTRDDAKVWLKAFEGHKKQYVIDALDRALLSCKYMPRPADVLECLKSVKEQESEHRPEHRPLPDGAPVNVARAWRYVISQWGGDGSTLFATKLSDDEVEEAILLVNQQVKQSGNWESLPAHLWLRSVHGREYPGVHN